jgi:hypothetical protein
MRLFGPTHEDIWRMFSEDIGAKFIIKDPTFKNYEVVKEFHDWVIVLDTYDSNNRYERVYTRVYCVFLNKRGFKFKVFSECFNNYLLSFFDMQDIKVDYDDLSENLIVRSNSEVAIKMFLENSTIRELISLQPDILLEIISEDGHEVEADADSTICVKIAGLIKNNEALKNLFELIGESLLEIENISNKIESLQVNNFTHLDVIKNSVKNTLMESSPYKHFKDSIINNSKKVLYKTDDSYSHGKSKINKSLLVRKSIINKKQKNGVSYTENSSVEIKNNSSEDYIDNE